MNVYYSLKYDDNNETEVKVRIYEKTFTQFVYRKTGGLFLDEDDSDF